MQAAIKNKSKLPAGIHVAHIVLAPRTDEDMHGESSARISMYLSLDTALESIIAVSASMTPAEARDLAQRLIDAVTKAEEMLAQATKATESDPTAAQRSDAEPSDAERSAQARRVIEALIDDLSVDDLAAVRWALEAERVR